MNQPLVTIRCTVFNHEPYLRQCLDGFIMQKTNFIFEAWVHDDASTDGSAAIIKEYAEKYPDIIKPYFEKENQYSKHDGSFQQITYNPKYLRGKYIALCEGDDYWIDPNKLQKQVDLLESHPDCVLCGTNGLIVYQDGLAKPSYFNKYFKNKRLDPEEIIGKWALPTASIMYRREVRENYPEWTKEIYSGDQTLMLIALSKGDIYVIGDLTCIYRKDKNGKSLSNVNNKDLSYVERQHLKLYHYYYDYITNSKIKELVNEHIQEIEHKIVLLEKYKKFNELYKKSFIRPFFWDFKYSYTKMIKMIKIHFANKLMKKP